jgi:glutathionyl-hydroquinone reductase
MRLFPLLIALTLFSLTLCKSSSFRPLALMAQYVEQIRHITSTTIALSGTEVHKAGTNDGWHGVIKEGGEFPPEKGRYHLYIGLFCPFAHRVNLVRHIKGLTDFIDISVVKPYPKGDDKGWPGWKFPKTDDEYPNATIDHLFGSEYLHEMYFKADKEYKGRYSVPLLWDKKTNAIVNNVRQPFNPRYQDMDYKLTLPFPAGKC